MSDPVLPTDPIKQDLPRPGSEPPYEHLPAISQNLIRDPIGFSFASAKASHTGFAIARFTTFADTQNREWSSVATLQTQHRAADR